MKLKIKRKKIGPGIARGIHESGREYYVIGGDLCYGESIDVVPSDKGSNLYINKKLNYESIDIFKKWFDKDKLIELSKLSEVPKKSSAFNRIYELNGFWVFPDRKIKNHLELLHQKNLTNESKIKISRNWISSISRAPVYSVNYFKMFKKVLTNRTSMSSWFICDREKDFDKGVYADLFVLGNMVENNFQLQLWQIIGQGEEVLYAHGLVDKDSLNFKHFDLATHYIDPVLIPKLIYDKKRIKISKKMKWLRVDGNIDYETVFDLIKMYFPLDHLVDEFTECSVNLNM